MPSQTKKCCSRKCSHNGTLQPLSEFYAKRGTPDGKHEECKTCIRSRSRQRESSKTSANHWTNMWIGGK